MLGDDDAPLESKALAELFLPELDRLRILKWREDVIQDYLGDGWRMLVHTLIVNGYNTGLQPVEVS